MIRSLLVLVASAALYGFSIGISNSWIYAGRNLVKFPLLILTTAGICALCYHVLARFLDARIGFVPVQRAVLAIFRDTAMLLAALAPAVGFLAVTMQRPQGRDLGGYPQFQGFNVIAIAVCGCLAVWQSTRKLGPDVVPKQRRNLLVGGWLLASLLVGGQVAWYMRPFFGISGPGSSDTQWFAGSAPDFRGATSFYEACFNLIVPPEGWR